MCWLADVTKCPLYIESHAGRGLGCVDDLAAKCMVDRGEMVFQDGILEMARRGIAAPGMIEALNPVGQVQ